MTRNDIMPVDELWKSAERWLPVFSPEEQRAGMTLFQVLARGERVGMAGFARALGATEEAAHAIVYASALSPFIHTDEAGLIQGFWGLSVAPTRHRLAVDGRALWTWCAQDALFLPELLGATAEVLSRDPETDQSIRLRMSTDCAEAMEAAGIVLSMGRPETWDAASAPRIIATACHYIHFFASKRSAESWQAKHPEPETILLSLDEAVGYGRRSNQHLFGAELARRRRATPGADGLLRTPGSAGSVAGS